MLLRVLLTAALLWPGSVRAAGGAGAAAVPELTVPFGARAQAMAGAFTGLANDEFAIYYNPAGLGLLNEQKLAASYLTGLYDDNLQSFNYGGPIPVRGFTDNGHASLGGSLIYASQGTITVNRTNADGSFQSSNNLNAGTDLAASLAYAEETGKASFMYLGRNYEEYNYVGATLKYIRSTLAQQYSAQTEAADFGYLGDIPAMGLSFGASALNMGGGLKYISYTDPLPATLKVGAAYQAHGTWGRAAFDMDWSWLLESRQGILDVGAEYRPWWRELALRMGYNDDAQGVVGLTAGIGLDWDRNFSFDFAWVMGSQEIRNQAMVTLSYAFGKMRPEDRRRKAPYMEVNPDALQEPTLDDIEKLTPSRDLAPLRVNEQAQPQQEERKKKGVPGWHY